jgi:hypothetical protein
MRRKGPASAAHAAPKMLRIASSLPATAPRAGARQHARMFCCGDVGEAKKPLHVAQADQSSTAAPAAPVPARRFALPANTKRPKESVMETLSKDAPPPELSKMELNFCTSWPCPYAQRTCIALNEANLAYKSIFIASAAG